MPAESFVELPRENNTNVCTEIRSLLSLEPVKSARVVCVKKFGCFGYKFVGMLTVTLLFPRKYVRTVDAVFVFFAIVDIM